MKTRSLFPIGMCLVVAFVLSCATPPPPIAESTATFSLISRDQAKQRWGRTFFENPFLEPTGLVQGQHDEFVLVDLGLQLKEATRVIVSAEVKAVGGGVVATLKDFDAMENYWTLWENLGNAGMRHDKLFDHCLPMTNSVLRKGSSHYVLVLVGKRPLSRPASVLVDVHVGEKNFAFEAALPAAPSQ